MKKRTEIDRDGSDGVKPSPRPSKRRISQTGAKSTHLEMIPLSKLVTLKRNPQYLTPDQMESLKSSIRRDGFVVPILARPWRDRYEVISGNHRFMAATELGMTQVPCVVSRMKDRDAKRLAVMPNFARVIESRVSWFESLGYVCIGRPHQGVTLKTQVMARGELFNLAGRLRSMLKNSCRKDPTPKNGVLNSKHESPASDPVSRMVRPDRQRRKGFRISRKNRVLAQKAGGSRV